MVILETESISLVRARSTNSRGKCAAATSDNVEKVLSRIRPPAPSSLAKSSHQHNLVLDDILTPGKILARGAHVTQQTVNGWNTFTSPVAAIIKDENGHTKPVPQHPHARSAMRQVAGIAVCKQDQFARIVMPQVPSVQTEPVDRLKPTVLEIDLCLFPVAIRKLTREECQEVLGGPVCLVQSVIANDLTLFGDPAVARTQLFLQIGDSLYGF